MIAHSETAHIEQIPVRADSLVELEVRGLGLGRIMLDEI